eukprot:2950246-Amphidinium_carterae.1
MPKCREKWTANLGYENKWLSLFEEPFPLDEDDDGCEPIQQKAINPHTTNINENLRKKDYNNSTLDLLATQLLADAQELLHG